jgi:serine/threonine-protein kinase HipA
LSGAQPKTALLRRGNRWGVPSGRVPTTHILKPPHERFPGHAENEHFCLTLARRMGVPAARSEIVEFDGALAIVIERFDRLISGDEVLRLHTEDYCQALATPAERKYENEGGPGAAAIAQSIANASSKRAEDLRAFADALVFNWLIAGTDAHAKNYSVLIGPGGVRFAPLYDLASALPYENIDQRALRLAMRVGRHYRLDTIQKRHWEAAAIALKVDREELMSRIREMTDRFPDSVSETARELRRSGLRHLLIGRLRDALVKRATDCRFAPIEPRAVR